MCLPVLLKLLLNVRLIVQLRFKFNLAIKLRIAKRCESPHSFQTGIGLADTYRDYLLWPYSTACPSPFFSFSSSYRSKYNALQRSLASPLHKPQTVISLAKWLRCVKKQGTQLCSRLDICSSRSERGLVRFHASALEKVSLNISLYSPTGACFSLAHIKIPKQWLVTMNCDKV